MLQSMLVIFLTLYWSAERPWFEWSWLSLFSPEQRRRTRTIGRALETGVGTYIRSMAGQLKRGQKIRSFLGENSLPAVALLALVIGGVARLVFQQAALAAWIWLAVLIGCGAPVVWKTVRGEFAADTVKIAKQSFFFGLGLSLSFMVLAAFDRIAPTIGALLQEAVNAAVILNVLRTRA
jgi:hypothetical protein